MKTNSTWKLKSGSLYAGTNGPTAALVSPDKALVFDSRDNPELKARFYGAVLGCKFKAEPCATIAQVESEGA